MADGGRWRCRDGAGDGSAEGKRKAVAVLYVHCTVPNVVSPSNAVRLIWPLEASLGTHQTGTRMLSPAADCWAAAVGATQRTDMDPDAWDRLIVIVVGTCTASLPLGLVSTSTLGAGSLIALPADLDSTRRVGRLAESVTFILGCRAGRSCVGSAWYLQ